MASISIRQHTAPYKGMAAKPKIVENSNKLKESASR
jgi:hypothetical protein